MHVTAHDAYAARGGLPALRRHDVNPIAECLAQSDLLDHADLAELAALPYREVVYQPGRIVHAVGVPADHVMIVLKGVGTVYNDLLDGSRQIIDLLLPGDIHGMEGFFGNKLGHSISAGTVLRFAVVERRALDGLLARNPRMMSSLFWASQRREQILRGHITAIGKRNARVRLAHFLCGLQSRQERSEPSAALYPKLSLTQSILADAIGLTSVHVGRVLRQLSGQRLIRLERGLVVILDLATLRRVAEFVDPVGGNSVASAPQATAPQATALQATAPQAACAC